jgi:hypothetical protein
VAIGNDREPPIWSAAPVAISADGCVQIRPIWHSLIMPKTTAHADDRI